MVKQDSGAEVVYDTSYGFSRGSGSRSYASEWRNFMSSNLAGMYKAPPTNESPGSEESEDEEMDMKKLLKDIEYLGSSNMSWKERKAMENRKALLLGGKPPKKQRLPLSVAKVPMKRQKMKEEKKLQEDILLGRYQRKQANKQPEKRKPGGDLLMPSDGIFKKGVLNVSHLLNGSAQLRNDRRDSFKPIGEGRRRGKGNAKGKKRGKKH